VKAIVIEFGAHIQVPNQQIQFEEVIDTFAYPIGQLQPF
jgi:hypothetical protein